MASQTTQISKSDRMELRRVVKSRFELLREQLQQRKAEVESAIRTRIERDSSEDIKTAAKESKEYIKQLQSIARDIERLQTKIEAKGIVTDRGWREGAISQMNDYIKRNLEGWKIDDISEQVANEIGRLKGEHGWASLNLRSEELSLLEDLSIDAIEGPQARKFLEKIPKVDDLLPLPSNTKKALTK